MDRFHLMSVFVAVAESESFAGGARRLGMSPPAVTRAVVALEDHLGVKLLTRTTRYVRVTDAGLTYLESARRIIGETNEADEAAAGVHAAPRGQLTVTAPVLFGRLYVMPGIIDYLQRYPDMTVSTFLLDRVVNLVEEGLDVGVRIGDLPDSTMRAIPVGHVSRVVCASPDYLMRCGVPDTPKELLQHTIVSASAVSPVVDWAFGAGKGSLSVKVHPRLTVSNNEAAILAALQGFGVSRLMSYQVAAHLKTGRLTRVLAEYEPPLLPIHVLHREGRQASAKVRTFVDLLVDQLRSNTALNFGTGS